MKPMKKIIFALLAVVLLAGCSETDDNIMPEGGSFDTAYLSLRVTYPTAKHSRASTEQPSVEEEAKVNILYVLTFDADKKVVKHHSATTTAIKIPVGTTDDITKLDAVKVNSKAKYLLIVANPGPVFTARLDGLATGTTYDALNAAIVTTTGVGANDKRDLLANEIRDPKTTTPTPATNFTMINAGLYNTTTNAWNSDCLVDITDNIVEVTGTKTEEDAKKEAEANRAELMIERLAAKVAVSVGTTITYDPEAGNNPSFVFGNWVLDYRNSTFYPFATKTKSKSSHTAGKYNSNFYTEDPNFVAGDMTVANWWELAGVYHNQVNTDRTYNLDWLAAGQYDYCIENTMAANDQRFGWATRLVIKGTFTPDNTEYADGTDWFYFAGQTYTFDELKARYEQALNDIAAAIAASQTPQPADIQFRDACDTFMTALIAAPGTPNLTSSTFTNLTAAELDGIVNGGEICKIPDCILWYQGGVNYYYYEIRHDNDPANGQMEYGKYGVVRNNWYALTLTSVSGRGTPWYPGGGPDDPDPKDPIDEGTAMLAFDITVAPWIYWTTEFGI